MRTLLISALFLILASSAIAQQRVVPSDRVRSGVTIIRRLPGS